MFRKTLIFSAKVLMIYSLFLPFACHAQHTKASDSSASKANLSLSVDGFFTTSYINTDPIKEKSSDSAGVLASFRYSFARFATFELNYGHAADTQYFRSTTTNAAVHTGAHEVTGAYVLTLPIRDRIHGFVLAGGGIMQFNPMSSGTTIGGTQSQNKPTILYGAGMDYELSRHIGLRLQYRGLLYATPSYLVEALRTNGDQAVAEPAFGVVYGF